MATTVSDAITNSYLNDWNDTLTTQATATTSFSLKQLYAVHQPSIILIDRYVTPLWYIVGFPGNLLAFVVWIRPRMRPSSGCYLAALAATDFLFLVLHLVFELQNAWELPTLNVPVVCELFPVFFLALQYLSPLLVLAFTVERYISVCYPFDREHLCTTRRSVTVIALLSCGAVSLHSIQAYFWQYVASSGDCAVRPEVTADGSRSTWTVWSWVTELLVFGLVPAAILWLNVRVIVEMGHLSTAEKRRVGGLKTFNTRPVVHNNNNHSATTTVMLLAVSFYLIAMTLPVTVVYAVYFSFPEGSAAADVTSDVTWRRHVTYWTVRAVVQEVGMSHYASNIFIYLATGKVFRSELRSVLGATLRPIAAAVDNYSPVYRRHHVADVGDNRARDLVASSVD